MVRQSYFALPDYPHDDEYDELLGRVAGRVDDSEVMVAVLDGVIVGCLTFVADHTGAHAEHGDPGAATFRYFAVDTQVQGRGVGEALVQWCIDEARRRGKQRMLIHTLAIMTAAHRLYERLGFVRRPDLDEQWGDVAGLAFVLEMRAVDSGV